MFCGSYKSYCAHVHVYYALSDYYNETTKQNILVVQSIFFIFIIIIIIFFFAVYLVLAFGSVNEIFHCDRTSNKRSRRNFQ